MNISNLSRTLKVNPKELREILPQVGFDIGQKALKIDNRTAQTIIRRWPHLFRQYKADQAAKKKEQEQEEILSNINREIKIPNLISVREFADALNLPVSKVLPELMKNGIFASLNEKIDFDTAVILGADLGVEVKLNEASIDEETQVSNKLKEALEKTEKGKLLQRSPVIVVMGHVDHGKTSLLDAIRKTNITEDEAGGITQHIGAYQVKRKDQAITFIDTPGHEAFTAMRGRGAKVADIAILIVAADDGVLPQTIESHKIIQAAGLPFIVAINKIDKEGANIEKTKQELSSKLNITPEDWGGKTVCALISAKKQEGIGDLLDMVLLTAEVEAENMKADPEAKAIGTVIESHVDKGEGPVATILVQNGTLKLNDQLCIDGQVYGKARALKDYNGQNIQKAEPSTPAKVIGLKAAPKVGDIAEVGAGKKVNLKRLRSNQGQTQAIQSQEQDDAGIQRLNIVLKTDTLGSGEAIEESLEKINTAKIKVKIIHRGLGNITEGDIEKAETADAWVIGFHARIPPQAEELARGKNIEVSLFDIIYDLIEKIETRMKEIVEPEWKRVDLGRLKVLKVFRTEKDAQIIGGKTLDGIVEKDALAEVARDKVIISEGKLSSLKIGQEDVQKAEIDQECGMRYEGKPEIEEGDILVFYKRQKVEQ